MNSLFSTKSARAQTAVAVLASALVACAAPGGESGAPASVAHIKARLSWGHRTVPAKRFYISLATNDVVVDQVMPDGLEAGDTLAGAVCESRAGAGDVDALIADLSWRAPVQPPRQPHEIWAYLLKHGTPGQIARLKDDPGLTPGAPVLTVWTSPDGMRGFSIGLEQLSRHKALWLPEHDLFVTLAGAPVGFEAHLASLKGERVLDRVKREPEAALEDYTSRWEDIGNPDQWTAPWQTGWMGTKGHLVGVAARHGSLYKFGVDRWANVRPDFASPHKFRLDLLWPGCKWAGQGIVNGLPVIASTFERNGQRCQVEQFSAPLHDAPPAKRGEIASVFHTRIQITGAGPVSLGFLLATENKERHPVLRQTAGGLCVVDRETDAVWLMIEPETGLSVSARPLIAGEKDPRIELECAGRLAAGETRTILLKLASPVVPAAAVSGLAALDYAGARAATVRYWEEWLAQGARFEVPEPAVNALYRASLWHALMLPRFRDRDRIDLPYSNFAYGQLNADWPINQAVYVDYMLYGLRGHFAVAEEEFAAMYRSQQKPGGRVGGYAEWGVYSPGMLYSIGQNFLLSGDRASFERLLPASLSALDWCLGEVARGQTSKDAPGLIVAPLNDLTHDARAWAFPNAYFVAGFDVFGRALGAFAHPRAAQVQGAAAAMRGAVESAFARASVRSPVVQLAGGTWNNYVPSDAMTPRRLLEQWYPTDVDCGPLHLARLSAVDPRGWLATAMLHDHEDNLFLNQWGAANEPVYNMQGTVYLLRDEPEAAIRCLYSMIACAFSHHQLSPLEHRWAWGQYYCPPSTDGAWFDLYRHMLVREQDDDSLLLLQAVPRKWMENGKRIRVERAPTTYGPLSVAVESRAAAGEISAVVEMPARKRPSSLRVRLRHPQGLPIRSVSVNAKDWTDYDIAKEWVRIFNPAEKSYTIVARY